MLLEESTKNVHNNVFKTVITGASEGIGRGYALEVIGVYFY